MAINSEVANTTNQAKDLDLPIRIDGIGRFVPSIKESNAEIEALSGLPAAVISKHLGVESRNLCDMEGKGESASVMGARAIEEACRDAGVKVATVDCIINASGTPERILPDGACLIQRELGLGKSGIPCFRVHATCLSFLVGYHVAASLLNSGVYRRIALVSSENANPKFFEPGNMHTYPLFGSLAVAVIVSRPRFTSYPDGDCPKISRYYFETFSDYTEMTTLKIGTSHYPRDESISDADISFQMDGRGLLDFIQRNSIAYLEKVQRGLSSGQLGDIKQVIPHQASGAGTKMLQQIFGKENVMTEHFSEFGNVIAAGIPGALFEAIKRGRVKRGDSILMLGTAAGVSTGALKFIY